MGCWGRVGWGRGRLAQQQFYYPRGVKKKCIRPSSESPGAKHTPSIHQFSICRVAEILLFILGRGAGLNPGPPASSWQRYRPTSAFTHAPVCRFRIADMHNVPVFSLWEEAGKK